VDPLIVTLVLDDAAQAWFDRLRRAYFPPERLQVGAHLTMFHALPGDLMSQVRLQLAACAAAVPPFELIVTGVRSLGRGTAFALAAEPAQEIRRRLAACFGAVLTPQDRAPWHPHVTVQNKVTAEAARRCLADLAASRPPAPVTAAGLALWHYRGGPWELADAYGFGEAGGRASILTSGPDGGELRACISPS
jgi:2'-5' RNA ligase